MTPDKCPKCGAKRRLPKIYLDPVFDCGSHTELMGLIESRGCIEHQRDQLAADNAALRERVKRLEEAGDRLATQLHSVSETEWISVGGALDAWTQAKEAKP